MPEVAACIDQWHAQEPEGWRKTRLLMVKLVARGESTSAQMADICGIARGPVFVWLRRLRAHGLAGLLERGQPGPKAGTCRGRGAQSSRATARQAAGARVCQRRAGSPLVEKSAWSGASLCQCLELAKKNRRSAAGSRVPVTPRQNPERKKTSRSTWRQNSRRWAWRPEAGSKWG